MPASHGHDGGLQGRSQTQEAQAPLPTPFNTAADRAAREEARKLSAKAVLGIDKRKVPTESALRRRARRAGYTVRKSRAGESLNQQGDFMLIDADSRMIVLGERFDASLADLDAFLKD